MERPLKRFAFVCLVESPAVCLFLFSKFRLRSKLVGSSPPTKCRQRAIFGVSQGDTNYHKAARCEKDFLVLVAYRNTWRPLGIRWPRKCREPLRVVCSGKGRKGPTGWYLLFLRFFRLVFLPIALIELTFSVTFYISLYLLVAGSPSHVDPLLAVRMYFRSEHSRLQLDPVTAHSFQAAPLL